MKHSLLNKNNVKNFFYKIQSIVYFICITQHFWSIQGMYTYANTHSEIVRRYWSLKINIFDLRNSFCNNLFLQWNKIALSNKI